ncbi:MAG: argininosuccinate lyase [Candidatus Melainabacteria bacterium]|nr:MAG: argininosuccinate lyase [Candidatus Melainabacteria bacterium]
MEVLRTAFKEKLNSQISEFVSSIDADEELILADLQGSIAHASMLGKIGLLTPEQTENILHGLNTIMAKAQAGNFELKSEYEDVHMNVEKALEKEIGADALRLHSARSRNDQVALDTRIFALSQIELIIDSIDKLKQALVDKAKEYDNAVMPGYTHLQPAQPIHFAHAMLAFFEMFERDLDRFKDAAKRTAVSPLGAGAQAGSGLSIDPFLSAKQLNFEHVFKNSIDAVCDRDFVAEFLFASALTATHLSQLAETLIIWTSKEFGFISFKDTVTTTSSLMPQKKNPDPIELIRGKTGSIFGELINILTTLKGLPLGYNRDLQETKPPLIKVAKVISSCLTVMTIAIDQMQINETKMLTAASDPEMMATDLVEYLVLKGLPFRESHEVVASVVSIARDLKISLLEMELTKYKSVSMLFDSDLYEVFDAVKSVEMKNSHGSTGTSKVMSALEEMIGPFARPTIPYRSAV